MNVRRAAKSDLSAIIGIAAKNPIAAQWRENEYIQALENVAARRTVLVAEIDNGVVGFLVARAIDHEWELENMAVDPSHHRKGTAAELLRSLIETAREHGAEVIFLEVRASNFGAKKLYESAGFQSSGLRPAYYSNPSEDAHLYRFLCTSESLENH